MEPLSPKSLSRKTVHRGSEWQTQNRYMMVDAFARIDAVEQNPILSISTEAA